MSQVKSGHAPIEIYVVGVRHFFSGDHFEDLVTCYTMDETEAQELRDLLRSKYPDEMVYYVLMDKRGLRAALARI